MEVIFVHRVGGTFSLLGSNRRGEEEKDINDASISSFPSVSSEYFYWALVTADDIRVAFLELSHDRRGYGFKLTSVLKRVEVYLFERYYV